MPKKTSRAATRAQQLSAAASVGVPAACDVCVVGAGAAGLVAAITAAEAGASVVVLERDVICGRPILATGNGRCNFANVHPDPRRYNCPEFVSEVCGARWLDDVLRFFRDCGLRWCLEDDRLYPVSRQAASVRNVLLARARNAGVVLAPAREVTRIEEPIPPTEDLPADGARITYRLADGLDTTPRVLRADSVIVASGGGGLPYLNGLALDTVPTSPALCPLACKDSPLRALDGRRAHVLARLTKADSFFPSWQERGEVLFRSYGISGIVTFDLSRRAEPGDLVELDLAPDASKSDLQQLVDPFAHGSFVPGCLDGVLDPEIARLLEQLAEERWHVSWPEHDVPETASQALIGLVKALPLVVEGPTETEHAQVTRGGLAVSQFDPATLACARHSWLFACGETLDVDADCGGHNLGWAWKSGMVAGQSASGACK